jgi:hypothetical protein
MILIEYIKRLLVFKMMCRCYFGWCNDERLFAALVSVVNKLWPVDFAFGCSQFLQAQSDLQRWWARRYTAHIRDDMLTIINNNKSVK